MRQAAAPLNWFLGLSIAPIREVTFDRCADNARMYAQLSDESELQEPEESAPDCCVRTMSPVTLV
jgi:hypothetical protein